MKAEEQRIAIAEACGWKSWMDEESGILAGDWSKRFWTPPEKHHVKYAVAGPPDYLNDLNAMHEAEKVLLSKCPLGFEDDLWEGYLGELCLAAPAGGMHHATAEQRSKAFLRALNLWTE